MKSQFADMAIRINNAYTEFHNNIKEQFGFTQEEAEKILTVFKKEKAVKLDPIMGKFNLTHGAYWDKEVMNRAIFLYDTNKKYQK